MIILSLILTIKMMFCMINLIKASSHSSFRITYKKAQCLKNTCSQKQKVKVWRNCLQYEVLKKSLISLPFSVTFLNCSIKMLKLLISQTVRPKNQKYEITCTRSIHPTNYITCTRSIHPTNYNYLY